MKVAGQIVNQRMSGLDSEVNNKTECDHLPTVSLNVLYDIPRSKLYKRCIESIDFRDIGMVSSCSAKAMHIERLGLKFLRCEKKKSKNFVFFS
jgi:hypothetical protein